MKKLLFPLMMLCTMALSAQLPDADYWHRKQIGFNWLFDEDTVSINRLHVGDGKFGKWMNAFDFMKIYWEYVSYCVSKGVHGLYMLHKRFYSLARITVKQCAYRRFMLWR
jgi:hypothetical protein